MDSVELLASEDGLDMERHYRFKEDSRLASDHDGDGCTNNSYLLEEMENAEGGR